MEDEKDKEIASLKQQLQVSSRTLNLYMEMFSHLQKLLTGVMEQIEIDTTGAEPASEVDRARFDLVRQVFVIMSDTIQKMSEVVNGNRK